MKEILLTEKRDGIPCVIIFPWYIPGLVKSKESCRQQGAFLGLT